VTWQEEKKLGFCSNLQALLISHVFETGFISTTLDYGYEGGLFCCLPIL
jgi:hypothetical protein